MANRSDWATAFLLALGAPRSSDNYVAVLAWIRSEWGGRAPIPATWNPLNTTFPLHPCTNYNDVGVKNYETFDQGVKANADTLRLSVPSYGPIRASLSAGGPALRTIDAVHASAWGSKPTDAMLAYVRQNLAAESALLVGAGTVPGPFPPVPPVPPVEAPLTQAEIDKIVAAVIARMYVVDPKTGAASGPVASAIKHETPYIVAAVVAALGK